MRKNRKTQYNFDNPQHKPENTSKTDREFSRMETKKKVKKSETKGWVISILLAIVIALLLRFFVFEFIRVEGPSMEPTLYTDERVFVEKVSYHFTEPKKNQVVICYYPDMPDTYVKRVIGVAGDIVEIRDGQLYINNKQVEDPHFSGRMFNDMEPFLVPDDTIFVMGDNRNHSLDSEEIGPIQTDQILGKAVFVIWPINKWKMLLE